MEFRSGILPEHMSLLKIKEERGFGRERERECVCVCVCVCVDVRGYVQCIINMYVNSIRANTSKLTRSG